MKAKIKREYDITVYPYEDDIEESSRYSLILNEQSANMIEMKLTCEDLTHEPMYLIKLRSSLLFVDPYDCVVVNLYPPFHDRQKIFDQLDETYAYDECQCAELATAAELAYTEYLSAAQLQESVPSISLCSWEG